MAEPIREAADLAMQVDATTPPVGGLSVGSELWWRNMAVQLAKHTLATVTAGSDEPVTNIREAAEYVVYCTQPDSCGVKLGFPAFSMHARELADYVLAMVPAELNHTTIFDPNCPCRQCREVGIELEIILA